MHPNQNFLFDTRQVTVTASTSAGPLPLSITGGLSADLPSPPNRAHLLAQRLLRHLSVLLPLPFTGVLPSGPRAIPQEGRILEEAIGLRFCAVGSTFRCRECALSVSL